MGGAKRRKLKVTVIIIEIVCLFVLAICAVVVAGTVVKRHNQEEAEKAAELTAEEEARQAELEKMKQQKELKKWNLLLVNPWKAMPDDFTVKTAEVENGYEMDERVVDAMKEMLVDCREAGYSPQIISSFRSRETQQYLYDHTANKDDTAIPGHSEHECGLAADVIDSSSAGWSDPLIDKQETLPAQKWLMEHCQDYGFILRYPKDKEDVTGIIYEPWHYRYVGKEHAAKIMSEGLCLEEYIEQLGGEIKDPEETKDAEAQ